MTELITVSITDDGKLNASFNVGVIKNPERLAQSLAFSTQAVAKAICHATGQPAINIEQIEAAISESYFKHLSAGHPVRFTKKV